MAWQAPHEVIEAQTGRLARRLVRAFAAEIPIYRRLPREELDGDITAITEHNLRVIAAMFRDDRPPTRAELAPLRDSAARRAQEGVPLESLLAAYHLGVRHVWEHLFAAAAPGDVDGVLAANRLILVYIEAVTAAVCTAYVEEREGMLSQEQHAMHATVAALLSGDLDALTGVRLAAAYQVLVLAIGPHPDERTSEIAGRRKVHRVRAALRRRSAEPVLSVLDPSGGTALIPGESDLAELGPALTKAADAPVWLAMESAAPADIPRAARLAGEVL
ncbi:MAG: PucR family transcriptional regulator, partial [Nonomuraea sp.]|nr:PucR family transcriptional regulator [Nonomuraea sp.]